MRGPDQPVLLTPDGLKRLEAELEELRTTGRAEVAATIHDAQEVGFAQTDGQYEEAKNQQAFLEGRIREIELMLERAQVIDEREAHASKEVRVGSSVTVKGPDGKSRKYQLVGPAEVDLAEGRISHESPVGQALLGKQRGDTIRVSAPSGEIEMTVTAVK